LGNPGGFSWHALARKIKERSVVVSDDSASLSPGHRDALHYASTVILDQCFQDLIDVAAHGDQVTDGFLYNCGYLPPAHAVRYDRHFLQCFASAITIVTWKLNHCIIPEIASVAEGLAAHAILREAELFLIEEGTALDLEPMWHLLFAGTDMLALFNASGDGMEAGYAVAGHRTASLAFEKWFIPFNGETAHLSFPIMIDRDILLEES
jgi:hypothetical protein